ncbi:MAG: DUF1450 domain-containing protein [Bacillota bacterium]|jgi:uncharacterized protein YuzB (UPF0349 family)
MIEVLFCQENLDSQGSEAYRRLSAANHPKLRVQVVKCIVACGDCATKPIARVNGQLVTADTAAELLQAIEQTIGFSVN